MLWVDGDANVVVRSCNLSLVLLQMLNDCAANPQRWRKKRVMLMLAGAGMPSPIGVAPTSS
jgi:hypothetical protein